MEYDVIFCENHDIDIFMMLNGKPVVITTNGGTLETDFDRSAQRNLFQWASELDESEDIVVNEDYVKSRLENQDQSAQRSYRWYYRRMARKGFYVFDRDVSDENVKDRYMLISCPATSGRELSHCLLPKFKVKRELFSNATSGLVSDMTFSLSELIPT